MKLRLAALVLPLALGLACAEQPASPDAAIAREGPMMAKKNGSGLVLESLTGVRLPLLGVNLGNVDINQAVITNFAVVEDLVGTIVGVEVDGILKLTGGVLGTDVLTQNFHTNLSVTSSGPGQCDIVTLDLGPINIDALVASVDVPAATVTGKGSGAVGSLLCVLGQLLNPITNGVRGIVQALNNQI